MNTKTINIVILVAGIILLAAGLNELGTFGSRLGRALGAGMSNSTLFLLVAGAACTAYSIFKISRK